MFLLILAYFALHVVAQQKAVVNVPVADLMDSQRGRECCPVNFAIDKNQLTQLLYMEPVHILSTSGSWTQVEAIDQPMRYNDTWRGYIGWLKTEQITPVSTFGSPSISVISQYTNVYTRFCHMEGCLPADLLLKASFGTWLTPIGTAEYGWYKVLIHTSQDLHGAPAAPTYGYVLESETTPFMTSKNDPSVRPTLARRSEGLLGFLYFWGGRSAFSVDVMAVGKQLTGLDCSGLVSICYKSLGWIIPRDASKQAAVVTNVTASQLRVGDLFFYGIAGNPAFPVTHVMMLHSLTPVPTIVESAGNSTRILPVTEAYGKPLKDLIWGQKIPSGRNAGARLTWGTMWGKPSEAIRHP